VRLSSRKKRQQEKTARKDSKKGQQERTARKDSKKRQQEKTARKDSKKRQQEKTVKLKYILSKNNQIIKSNNQFKTIIKMASSQVQRYHNDPEYKEKVLKKGKESRQRYKLLETQASFETLQRNNYNIAVSRLEREQIVNAGQNKIIKMTAIRGFFDPIYLQNMNPEQIANHYRELIQTYTPPPQQPQVDLPEIPNPPPYDVKTDYLRRIDEFRSFVLENIDELRSFVVENL
jgi:hypothetical protein